MASAFSSRRGTTTFAAFGAAWRKSTRSAAACLEAAVVEATIVDGRVTGYALVPSRPGPGIGLEALKKAVGAAAAEARAELGVQAGAPGPRPGPELDQYCLTTVEHLVRELFPYGIRARVTRDDATIGTGQSARRFLGVPPAVWGPVTSWDALIDAVRRARPGAVAVAVIGRRMRAPREPGGPIPAVLSHTIVLTNTGDNGVAVTDPARARETDGPGDHTRSLDEATDSATAVDLGPLADARALFIDPAGQVIAPPRTGVESRSRDAEALTEPADPRTGSSNPPAARSPGLWSDDPAGRGQRDRGDCLMHALLDSDDGWLPEDARTVQGIRDRLADALRDREDYQQALNDDAFYALAEDHARRQGYEPDHEGWWRAVNEYANLHTTVDWGRIITELRTPGSWNNAAGDLAPQLAGWVFNLRINVQGGDRPHWIGNRDGHPIDLRRHGTHWQSLQTSGPAEQRAGTQSRPVPVSPPSAPVVRDGRPGRPITAATAAEAAASVDRHVISLVERMNNGPLIEIYPRQVDPAVLPLVLATIEERHPRMFQAWMVGNTVRYGTADAARRAGVTGRPITATVAALSVARHVDALIAQMDREPIARSELIRLRIDPGVRPLVLAEIEERRRGEYVTWGEGRIAYFGTADAARAAGAIGLPIDTPDAVRSVARNATTLVAHLRNRPLTTADLGNLDAALRPAVLAEVERQISAELLTWQVWNAVYYGTAETARNAGVHGPGLRRHAAEADVAERITAHVDTLINRMRTGSINATVLHGLGIDPPMQPTVFGLIEERHRGEFRTWQRVRGIYYGTRQAASDAGVNSLPITATDHARTVAQHAGTFVTHLRAGPRTTVSSADVATHPMILAQVEEWFPREFVTWNQDDTDFYGTPADAAAAAATGLPITATRADRSVGRQVDVLVARLRLGPLTEDDLGTIDAAARPMIFARIDEWYPGEFRTWRVGETTYYGRVDDVPAEGAPSPRTGGTDLPSPVSDAMDDRADLPPVSPARPGTGPGDRSSPGPGATVPDLSHPGEADPMRLTDEPVTSAPADGPVTSALANALDADAWTLGLARRRRAALEPYGRRWTSTARGDDSFLNAFSATAGPAVLGGTYTAIELRQRLARALANPAVRRMLPDDVLNTAYWTWRSATARRTGLPVETIDEQWALTGWAEPWDSIARDIEERGTRADEGGDLIPYLAAHEFGVRIQAVRPDGTARMISTTGDHGETVTLFHPGDHWDATEGIPPAGSGPHTTAAMSDGPGDVDMPDVHDTSSGLIPEDPAGRGQREYGDCLMNALFDAAPGWLPADVRTAQDMRNRLADALRDTRRYRDALREPVRRFIAEDHAARLYPRGSAIWVYASDQYAAEHPEVDWAQIITDLRTPGSWDNAAGDIAPFLAGWVFNLRIHVREGNRSDTIGDGRGYSIFLARNGNHWRHDVETVAGIPAGVVPAATSSASVVPRPDQPTSAGGIHLDDATRMREAIDAAVRDLPPGLRAVVADARVSVAQHVDTLIDAMDDHRLTRAELHGIEPVLRPLVLDVIERLRPGVFRAGRQSDIVYYGRTMPDQVTGLRINATEAALSVSGHADALTRRMENGPVIRHEIRDIELGVRPQVLDEIQRRHRDVYRLWRVGGGAFYYGRAPEGVTSLPINASDVALREAQLVGDLIRHMDDAPLTATHLERIDRAVRSLAFARVQWLSPGRFGTWRQDGTTYYGRAPENVASRPIDTPDSAVATRMTRLSDDFMRRMDGGRLTGRDLHDFDLMLRPPVFADIHERGRGTYRIWTDGSDLFYGRQDHVPNGVISLAITATNAEVAVARRAEPFVALMNARPLAGAELDGVDPAVRSLVFELIERLFPGMYRTWWQSDGVYYGRADHVPQGVPSLPIADVGHPGTGTGAGDD